MQLTSPNFLDGEHIPHKFTCQGENINPELQIAGVSSEAHSLVLIVDDPDAPEGNWVHWILWNMPPTTEKISSGILPPGAKLGITSFQETQYKGPCPPSGEHRYFFKLFALDINLTFEHDPNIEEIEKCMNGHIHFSTELVGFYKKE